MKRMQFIVEEFNKNKREKFYDYITKKYDLRIIYPYTRERFIDSKFPFIVDFKETFVISATYIPSLVILLLNENFEREKQLL